jgi:NAD(P)-dependent dehydrogenase (short-subunit alcohol dehydrogenase family)
VNGQFSLEGRAALVTGAGPNIGCGIGIALAEAGAVVACVDLDKSRAEIVVSEIEERGGTAAAFACDVSDRDEVVATVVGAEEFAGQPIDILVNAAAMFNTRGIRDCPLSQWRAQLAVILDGTFLCTQRVVNRLIEAERPGVVINILSTAAHQGEPGNLGYCTAKSGLLNFTRSAAVELAPFNIRVNSLTPTATDASEYVERARKHGLPLPEGIDSVLGKAASQVPLKRLPKPSDYGAAAVYLASDAAAFVTGFDLRVDSGSVAQYWRDVGDQSQARRLPEEEI